MYSDKTYQTDDFKNKALERGEYEGCTFVGCDFSEMDLTDCAFSECRFQRCNLSNVRLFKTAFRSVWFLECKLLGFRLDTALHFGLQVGFEHCNLNYASFYQVPLRKTMFRNCQLQEADFTEADCRMVVFDHCDLHRATFERSDLSGADFRSAQHFSIDPTSNKLKKAQFAASNLSGLLHRYDIEIEP